MLESIVSQSAISRQVPQDLKDVGFFSANNNSTQINP